MTINSDLRDQHAGEIINLQLNNHLSIESVNNVMNSRKSSGEFRYLEETQPEEIQAYATIDGHEGMNRE